MQHGHWLKDSNVSLVLPSQKEMCSAEWGKFSVFSPFLGH